MTRRQKPRRPRPKKTPTVSCVLCKEVVRKDCTLLKNDRWVCYVCAAKDEDDDDFVEVQRPTALEQKPICCGVCGCVLLHGCRYAADGKSLLCLDCPSSQVESGRKHDSGKPRFDLIDPYFLEELALVLTQGAEKYGDTNYQNVAPERYVAAIGRHMNTWRQGKVLDMESGLSHLVHVVANCMFLYVNTLPEKVD